MSNALQFDMQPSLRSETLLLRPMREDDFDALYAVGADPLIWEQTPYPLRYQASRFREYFDGGIASRGSLVVIEKSSRKLIGCSRYYEWNPELGEVAIGYTFLGRSHWGGSTNAEMKRLMLDHAFAYANTVWFHVAMANKRSRRAMEKIGGIFCFNADREVNGVTYDYAFIKIEKG